LIGKHVVLLGAIVDDQENFENTFKNFTNDLASVRNT